MVSDLKRGCCCAVVIECLPSHIVGCNSVKAMYQPSDIDGRLRIMM